MVGVMCENHEQRKKAELNRRFQDVGKGCLSPIVLCTTWQLKHNESSRKLEIALKKDNPGPQVISSSEKSEFDPVRTTLIAQRGFRGKVQRRSVT